MMRKIYAIHETFTQGTRRIVPLIYFMVPFFVNSSNFQENFKESFLPWNKFSWHRLTETSLQSLLHAVLCTR
jgi:hypothetical protein